MATMFMVLVPIMWSTGAGADVMKRVATPIVGDICEIWKWHYGLKQELQS